MDSPIDTGNRLLRLAWKVNKKLCRFGNVPSYLVGAALYPIELLLTKIMREGPTVEIMLCRKKANTEA
jgi:hypothetical protein